MFCPVHICFFALLALGAVNSAQASTCEGRGGPLMLGKMPPKRLAKNADVIAELEELVFTLEGEDAERIGTRTDAVVIIKSGRLTKIRAWLTADKPHLTWSITKSITSALTGLAVSLGVLSLDTSICDYYADLPPDTAVTVQIVRVLHGF